LSCSSCSLVCVSRLSKLFDSIARLELAADMKTPELKLKSALAMFSKENEHVKFPSPCDLNGQVEIWLNRLLVKMRETVRQRLSDAINAYEEKPRELWVQDYPAQIGIDDDNEILSNDRSIVRSLFVFMQH
jgi:dynein heavy chain, axonemal